MKLFRRNRFSLCDETVTPPAAAGKWMPLPVDDGAPSPRTLVPLDRRALEDNYLAAMERLREVTADRDRLDEANGRLLERIRGLELTVTALTASRPKPLHVEDDQLLIRPLAGEDGA